MLALAASLNSQWAERAFSVDPARDAPASAWPLSFVYGGRPSAEFIHRWTTRSEVDQLGHGRVRRTLTLTDPATQLEVKAVATVYTDTPGVDWTVYLTNRGTNDTPVIEQVKALNTEVEVGGAATVTLHRLNGSPSQADDWLPFDQPVPAGQRIEFAATNGRSANVSPWFNVDWGTGGVITAIGWSGQWTAAVECKDGRVRVEAGMQNLRTVLHPGETIRSPRILQLRWQGGDPFAACNQFRQTMLAHIMPRLDGKPVVPPIVHLSDAFYERNATTESNVLSHLASLKDLGFEMFWLDAYWTGPSGFPNCMGNYGFPIERVEPRDRFPRGLKVIGEAVRQAGLGFVMWFEPERVAPGTFLAKEHPEWVLSPAGDGSGLFNLGLPAARQYMTDYLNAVIQSYRIDCLRIDYNIDPLAYWQFMDAKDPRRTGMTELRYVEGVYRMWDDLLKANPHLFIDNCASGGRRIDLETMARAIPLWRSDNTCDMEDAKPGTILAAAIKNQVMSAGLNRYVPYSTVGQMGTTPYLFRSGFNAGIAFCQDCRPTGFPREQLKEAIAEGKRLRKYYAGNFYPLSPVTTSPEDWCVLQYHRPAQRDGLVVAFRRDRSPYTVFRAALREIDPDAQYDVSFAPTYEPAAPVRLPGAQLRDLRIEIAGCPGSVVVEYRCVGSPKTPATQRKE